MDPSSATAAPSHLCRPGMEGPNSSTMVSSDELYGAGPGGATRASAPAARAGGGLNFLPRHIFSRWRADAIRGEPAVAEGRTAARGMHGDARCAVGRESVGAVRGGSH